MRCRAETEHELTITVDAERELSITVEAKCELSIIPHFPVCTSENRHAGERLGAEFYMLTTWAWALAPHGPLSTLGYSPKTNLERRWALGRAQWAGPCFACRDPDPILGTPGNNPFPSPDPRQE